LERHASSSKPFSFPELPNWARHALLLLIAVGSSPLLFHINQSPWLFPPDSFAYLAFAPKLLESGILYLSGWGHVDAGLILPPLFPFLVGIAQIIGEGTLATAEYVSTLCMLLSLVPLYFLLQRSTNGLVALFALYLVQINYTFFVLGFQILTEATFFLTLSTVLLFTDLLLSRIDEDRPFRIAAIIVGAAGGLALLARQIGIVFLPFLVLLAGLHYTAHRNPRIWRALLWSLLGWSLISLPYMGLLFQQTGQSIFTQRFRLEKRIVHINNPKDLDRLSTLQSMPAKDYWTSKQRGRALRELTVDASEMYQYAFAPENKGAPGESNLFRRVARAIFSDPAFFLRNFARNFGYLVAPMGTGMGIGFLLLLGTPFLPMFDRTLLPRHLLLPLFILTYITCLSFLTAGVDRYAKILFPFAFIFIVAEVFRLTSTLLHLWEGKIRINPALVRILMLAFFFLTAYLAMPTPFSTLEMVTKYDESFTAPFRRVLKTEPVFCPHPKVWMFGGYFRTMPNDSLEKIVRYGQKTGVSWLFVDRSADRDGYGRFQYSLYENASWYWEADLQQTYPDLLQLTIVSPNGRYALFRLNFSALPPSSRSHLRPSLRDDTKSLSVFSGFPWERSLDPIIDLAAAR
jgi:hypothetical protein